MAITKHGFFCDLCGEKIDMVLIGPNGFTENLEAVMVQCGKCIRKPNEEYKRAYFQLWDSLLDDSKVRKIRAMFGDFSKVAQINIFDPDIISPNDLIEAYKRTNSVDPRPS